MTTPLLLQGTALALPLRDASVQCCVCSPPYYGLRSYGIGAAQGEIGLEPTLEAYLSALVAVFREVHRVLHPSGTCWVVIGDSMQDKNLCMVPARLALALQADGWYLRSEIVWHKPSCMPESVQDRPTRDHEMVYLLAKLPHYFYDGDAIKERMGEPTRRNAEFRGVSVYKDHLADKVSNSVPRPAGTSHAGPVSYAGRNARSVWTITGENFTGAHYATFPTELVRRCILAGTSAYGACAACSAPYRRMVERQRLLDGQPFTPEAFCPPTEPFRIPPNGIGHARYSTVTTEQGWEPTCRCDAAVTPCRVFDPFCGSGTTLLVARELGRQSIGVDLSYPYLHDIARQRLGLADLARWEGRNGHTPATPDYTALPLFAGGTS